MTAPSPPPLMQPIVAGETGETTLPWLGFFDEIHNGDAGVLWTPTFTSLSGTATITGTFARINQNFAYWDILIDPTTPVSATAGTTYAEGFPLTFRGDSFCIAVSGGVGGVPGHVVSSTQRIFIPALSSVTVPITISGVAYAS